MSTIVPFSRDRCPDQEALISFLYDEFDGSEAFDRRSISKHVEDCDRCARILGSLGGVRQRLRAWNVPETSPLAFRIVSDARRQSSSGGSHFFGFAGWMKPAFPLAAAAALVLGAALGLARLDGQYDQNGLRIHTGWTRDTQNAQSALAPAGSRTALANTPVSTAGTISILSPVTDQNRPVTQADLQMLAQALRQELTMMRQGLDASGGRGAMPTAPEAAFLKRVQQMNDQSEVRQQQNLALRITEVSRDFDLQRRSDLAQIEQGFGRLAGQREVDAQQQRLLLNAIRTSQQVPISQQVPVAPR